MYHTSSTIIKNFNSCHIYHNGTGLFEKHWPLYCHTLAEHFSLTTTIQPRHTKYSNTILDVQVAISFPQVPLHIGSVFVIKYYHYTCINIFKTTFTDRRIWHFNETIFQTPCSHRAGVFCAQTRAAKETWFSQKECPNGQPKSDRQTQP